jgi:hypothetical protein
MRRVTQTTEDQRAHRIDPESHRVDQRQLRRAQPELRTHLR